MVQQAGSFKKSKSQNMLESYHACSHSPGPSAEPAVLTVFKHRSHRLLVPMIIWGVHNSAKSYYKIRKNYYNQPGLHSSLCQNNYKIQFISFMNLLKGGVHKGKNTWNPESHSDAKWSGWAMPILQAPCWVIGSFSCFRSSSCTSSEI